MAEKIVSPGVYTRESDQSQITEGPIVVDAAIIGPTTKGPVEEPTIVTSYSDFTSKFGGALESASQRFTFLNNIAANNFFQQGGESLLVVRAVSGSYSSAKTLTGGGAGANNVIKSGSTDNLGPFSLATISKGTINNSESPVVSDVLTSGSGDNINTSNQTNSVIF